MIKSLKVIGWGLFIVFLLMAVVSPRLSFAQSVGDTGFEKICNKTTTSLPQCIQNIYLLSLGLGSVVALFILVIAGYMYMTASGNAQQVESAKEMFASALTGLVIIFIAFILLNLINPDLVKFKSDVNSTFKLNSP